MNNYITGRVSFLTLETFDETNIVLILTTTKKPEFTTCFFLSNRKYSFTFAIDLFSNI